MTSSARKETPEVAASEAPKPIPHVTDQKGDPMISHNPVNPPEPDAGELLRTAADLAKLAIRWLVAAERAMPEDVPLFAAVDTVNGIGHIKKAVAKIQRAEVALNSDTAHPVDPTGPLTIGSIPDDDLGPLFDATIQVAINERFPGPFQDLDYKDARDLAITAAEAEKAGMELSEPRIWRMRYDMYAPYCSTCDEGGGLHLATCPANSGGEG